MDNLEKFYPSEKSEKQLHWEEITARTEHVVDGLGKPIDKGIKEGVIALNAFDINTTSSCEGHEDWGIFAPYIDIEARNVEELKQQVTELRNNKEENRDKIKELADEVTRRNLEERKKLFVYLDEFYGGRDVPFYKRLIVENRAYGWSRLESQGADLQEIEIGDAKKQRLVEFQNEMNAFVTFLKEKYFEGKGMM